MNVLSLIELIPDGIVKDVNDSHRKNALDPIDVTVDGTVIDGRFEQPEKAYFSIDIRFELIFTVVRLMHPSNVLSAIVLTPDGIVIDFNDSHAEKAYAPMDIT